MFAESVIFNWSQLNWLRIEQSNLSRDLLHKVPILWHYASPSTDVNRNHEMFKSHSEQVFTQPSWNTRGSATQNLNQWHENFKISIWKQLPLTNPTPQSRAEKVSFVSKCPFPTTTAAVGVTKCKEKPSTKQKDTIPGRSRTKHAAAAIKFKQSSSCWFDEENDQWSDRARHARFWPHPLSIPT